MGVGQDRGSLVRAHPPYLSGGPSLPLTAGVDRDVVSQPWRRLTGVVVLEVADFGIELTFSQ